MEDNQTERKDSASQPAADLRSMMRDVIHEFVRSEDAKAEPSRFYRTPNDVLRDRRLSDTDRRTLLQAWETKMLASGSEPEIVEQVRRALGELDDGADGDDGEGRRHRQHGRQTAQ